MVVCDWAQLVHVEGSVGPGLQKGVTGYAGIGIKINNICLGY